MASIDTVSVSEEGLEDQEEFDDPANLVKSYCKPISEHEFEELGASETEKALVELMDYLDDHRDYYKDLLKKKKRQELENGGVISFLKVRVMDMIHGENSPLVKVTEEECEQKMDSLKNNMHRVFDYSLECKGRRISKRLAEKRQKRSQQSNGTPSRKVSSLPKMTSNQGQRNTMPPPPPPPPPPPISTPTVDTKTLTRKPFTPLQDRLNIQNVTPRSQVKLKKPDMNDSLEPLPALNCSLTSLHQELLSSNPWKRLRCVNDDRSPRGTPARKKTAPGTPGPGEPLYQALLHNIQDKFRNARSPSPAEGMFHNNVTSPSSALSPFE